MKNRYTEFVFERGLRVKTSICSTALAVFILFSGFTLLSKEINPDLGIIARITANILSSKQFRHKPLDDKVSEELFKEYLDELDPYRIYFTQEDVLDLSEYADQFDDMLQKGDVSEAFKIYDLLIKRMEEYKAFADKEIDKGFDFSKNEEFVYDRDKAERPTEKNQKELWRKKIKNDLLTMKLADKAMTAEKPESSDEKKERKVEQLWKKTPEERLKKRIDTVITMLKKKRDIDKLEFFLGSLARIYDPHSAYMAPSQAENFDIAMKNSLVGIGAVLSSVDGYTKIVSVVKGGPADKEGELEAGDRIVAVAQGDKEPVDIIDMPLDEVVNMIRGEKDTIVRLFVIKGSEGLHGVPKTITIKRDKVELKAQDAQSDIKEVTVNGKKMKVGIIDLPSFYVDFQGAYEHRPNYKSSTRDVKNILEKFNKENVDGVILDLRRNGGGGLQEAIKMTGLFIDQGPVVQVKGADNPVPEVESDLDGKTYFSGPVIVLLSRYSASAAEIFAAAIQDYGRGVIVGDKNTHGKGTVQTVLKLSNILRLWGLKEDPGQLKITVAKFYRINGESTQLKGVKPDIVIPNFTDSMKLGESNLEYALPWDTINPAHYDKVMDLTPVIKDLKAKSEARRASDKEFLERKKMLANYAKMMKRKSITLNEKKRWEQYLADKKIFDEQKALLERDKTSESDKDKKDGKDVKGKKDDDGDVILKEAVNIMKDWLARQQKEEEQELSSVK